MTTLDRVVGLLSFEAWFNVFMLCFFAVLLGTIYFFSRRDFSGKNRGRLEEFKRRFGSNYEAKFRLGEMRAQAKAGHTPTPDEAIAMARFLWDGDAIGNGTVGIYFEVFSAEGIRCLVVLAVEFNDGRKGFVVTRIDPPGRFWSKREVVKIEPVQEAA